MGASDLLTEARLFLIPGSLFFLFYNLSIDGKTEKSVISMFYWFGVVALAFGLLMATIPYIFRSFISFPDGYWMAFYAGLFSWSIALSDLLWKGFSWISTGVVALALSVGFFYLGNKPIVFTLLVILGLHAVIGILSKRKAVMWRAWGVMLSVPATVVFILVLLPRSLINEIAETFAERYLKLRSVYSVEELQTSISRAAQKDLSAGRFGVWESYLGHAVDGFGLAPDGFGGVPRIYMPLHGSIEAFPAHNTIIYIAYHGGLIAAVLYTIIIVRFTFEGTSKVHKWDMSNLIFERSKLIGIFVFIVGIIAVGLVGGPLRDYRLAWFFWFLTALIMKRYNAE
jgi:hypothetical protein